MKESVKIGDGAIAGESKIRIRDIALHAVAAVIGFCVSRAQVFSVMSPFGISLAAGCGINLLPAVTLGAFLGYFGAESAFRYIAALLAVVAIRTILSGYKTLSSNPYFLGLLAAAAGLFTSLLALWRLEKYALRSFLEVILIFGVTFFVARLSSAYSRRFAGLSSDEMVSLLIVINILLISFSNIEMYGVAVGRILGLLLIFISSKYGGVLSGAVSGIAVCFSQIITGSFSHFVLFCLGGIACGLFSNIGRIAQICAMLLCAITELAISASAPISATLCEIILSSAAFIGLPSSAGVFFGKVFSCYPKIAEMSGVKKGMAVKLGKASSALDDVSNTVEQVAKKLSEINSPNFSRVASLVERDTCLGCIHRISCWENERRNTVGQLVEITKAVRAGEAKPFAAASEDFKIKCLRLEKLGEAVKQRYEVYAGAIAAENRMQLLRGVVSDQFSGMSALLSSMKQEIENEDRFDNAAALSAAAALKNLGIITLECYAKIDKLGRMSLEFKVKKGAGEVFNRLQIMRMLSLCCERDFDVPTITETNGDTYITICEHAKYSMDIGVCQIAADGNSLCGDSYRSFFDGSGRYYMILSDGMGTGSRAAVDSTFVSGIMAGLLKAGFDYSCALKILNSSMLFKSTDESMASLDIACVDLFSGKTELLKAGAAASLILRSGKSGKAESRSLPVGILRDVTFDKAQLKLKAGDIIVLLSDGAIDSGLDWIRNILEDFKGDSAQKLCEIIAQGAKRRSEGRGDDITVMAGIIENRV